MNIGMTLGPTLTVRHELSQRQLLLQQAEQRLEHGLAIRTELLKVITGSYFEPAAECPRCGHNLTAVEILKGFRSDPDDLTTGCPKCSYRFHAKMILKHEGGRTETTLYCPTQTLAALPKPPLSPEGFRLQNMALYNSAVYHFGGLKKAYNTISFVYPYSEEPVKWAEKVMDFLGKVPDPLVASVAGVSVYKVKKLRRESGISGFRGYPAEEYQAGSSDDSND